MISEMINRIDKIEQLRNALAYWKYVLDIKLDFEVMYAPPEFLGVPPKVKGSEVICVVKFRRICDDGRIAVFGKVITEEDYTGGLMDKVWAYGIYSEAEKELDKFIAENTYKNALVISGMKTENDDYI